MARLFRHGVPCDADVVKHRGGYGNYGMASHHLEHTSLSNVVIVDDGQAWRALRKTYHTQGRNIILECTPLRATDVIQEILLADMLLN